MSTMGFCRQYYTKNIKKFARYDFLAKHLNTKSFALFKGITPADCQRWGRIPIEYLSAREALALGIYIRTTNITKDASEKALKYLEYAVFGQNSKTNEEIRYYALMALGIFYFDEALKNFQDKQIKILKICDYYFGECEALKMRDELLALHQMILQIAKQDKAAAVRYLVRASKIAPQPQILFQILSSIYLELGMERASQFYFSRSEQEIEEDHLAA